MEICPIHASMTFWFHHPSSVLPCLVDREHDFVSESNHKNIIELKYYEIENMTKAVRTESVIIYIMAGKKFCI